jgi:hypothetical protein
MHQIYVQAFPSSGEKRRISASEGIETSWSSDGRELVIFSSDGTVWSVPVTTGPEFRSGPAQRLLKSPVGALWITPFPDHRRFLISMPEGNAPPATITVVQNWWSEILARK